MSDDGDDICRDAVLGRCQHHRLTSVMVSVMLNGSLVLERNTEDVCQDTQILEPRSSGSLRDLTDFR